MAVSPAPAVRFRAFQRFRKNWHHYKWGYLFILPDIILFAVWILWPVVHSFLLSFQQFGIFGNTWVGLDNYKYLIEDPVWWVAVKNTAIFTFIVVPQNIVVALFLASMLRPLSEYLQSFFRMAYYLPGVASAVTISLVWRWMYDAQNGLINQLLESVGFEGLPWLSHPDTALMSIIFMAIAAAPGGQIILYLASMKKIPEELYESVEIDGGGTWAKFRHVTLPLLKPTTLYLFVTSTIASFQVFTTAYIMTGGGPGYATTFIVLLIYNTGFRDFAFGLASAQAIVLFAIIAVAAIIQFRRLGSDIEY